MALCYFRTAGRLASTLVVGGLIWAAAAAPASAQAPTVSSQQILNMLAPPITRSLTAPAVPSVSGTDQTFIDSLRHHARALTVEESDRVADLAKTRAKIDLEIYFDFNSAAITAKAEPQLKELGEALRNARLDNAVIVIGGHTDGKGSDEYNQKLSERRAMAVKAYLTETMKVSPENLTTAGYGKRDLKNTENPFAAENRRVELVNMNATAQASR